MLPLAANTRAWLVVAGILVAIAVVLVAIERLFAWLSKNGARAMRNDRASGLMGNVLDGFEGFVRPEKQLVQEEREQRKADVGITDPSDR